VADEEELVRDMVVKENEVRKWTTRHLGIERGTIGYAARIRAFYRCKEQTGDKWGKIEVKEVSECPPQSLCISPQHVKTMLLIRFEDIVVYDRTPIYF
jgi:hypothetical protein